MHMGQIAMQMHSLWLCNPSSSLRASALIGQSTDSCLQEQQATKLVWGRRGLPVSEWAHHDAQGGARGAQLSL